MLINGLPDAFGQQCKYNVKLEDTYKLWFEDNKGEKLKMIDIETSTFKVEYQTFLHEKKNNTLILKGKYSDHTLYSE